VVSPRLSFHKVTPDGLAVEVVPFEGHNILLLAKNIPGGSARPAQILGEAGQEVNTPTLVWYYEYGPLAPSVPVRRLIEWLETRGYLLGTFDQFGNFSRAAAA